jgi:hypothetical protein
VGGRALHLGKPPRVRLRTRHGYRNGHRQVNVKQVRAMLLAQGQYLLGEEIDETLDETLKLHRHGGSGSSASHHNPFLLKS